MSVPKCWKFDKDRVVSEDKKIGTRLPLPRCEFAVRAESEEGIEACGEAAVASWRWGNDRMFVCEKHDEIVSQYEDGEG